jgi:hypothetical protein
VPKLAVTGVTGNLGRIAAEDLLLRVAAADLIAIARRPEQAAPLTERGVEVRHGDYARSAGGGARAGRSRVGGLVGDERRRDRPAHLRLRSQARERVVLVRQSGEPIGGRDEEGADHFADTIGLCVVRDVPLSWQPGDADVAQRTDPAVPAGVAVTLRTACGRGRSPRRRARWTRCVSAARPSRSARSSSTWASTNEVTRLRTMEKLRRARTRA